MRTIYQSPKLHRFAVLSLLVVLCTAIPKFAKAQFTDCGGGKKGTVTNSGTEFLLVFMQNEDKDYEADLNNAANFTDVYIAALDLDAVVTITCKQYPTFSRVVNLSARTSSVVHLLSTAAPDFKTFIVQSNESVDQTVVKVTSTAPIVCYGMNHKSQTADAFLALPLGVASNTYMVMCYPNSTNSVFGSFLHPTEFAVAAFKDNTKITIVPSAATFGGTQPGTPMHYTLNAGECVQIQGSFDSDPNGDLTGSLVTADEPEHPIAVFSGHRRAEVPHNFVYYTDLTPHSSRDHLAEQIPPMDTWGNSFIVTNFKGRTFTNPNIGDQMRVLVSADNTTVKINGKPWVTLNRGQYRDTIIQFNPILDSNIFAVETSNPAMVGMFARSTDAAGGLGDPFFAIVPPLSQTYNDFTYFISENKVYTLNNIIIVAEASAANNITINGVLQPSASYTSAYGPINGKMYKVATFNQPQTGINRARTTNTVDKGFTILAYGFGVVDSYGYTAGSLLVPNKPLIDMHRPAAIPAPGSEPKLPTYYLRNIVSDPLYVDSMRISYASNPEGIIVEGKNVPMNELAVLQGTEEMKLILSPRSTPKMPITGTATIYSHTGLWRDLEPFTVPFVIQPGSTASVGVNTDISTQIELYPNPVRSDATLAFTTKAAAHVTVEIFDALGRLITTPACEMMGEGAHQLHISGKDLPNGMYICKVSAPTLGVSLRSEFIVNH